MKKSIIAATIISIATALPAMAEQNNTHRNYGFSLPTAPMPSGFDEVRASDGTTCRSSMAGNGAYLDVGGIGGQSRTGGSMDSGTVYGRLIIPLGKKPGRIDCRSLYQLEIDRLKHELRLAKGGAGTARPAGKGQWQESGWNNQ